VKSETSKCLIYPEKWNFCTLRGVSFLIHNLRRVTLWTSGNFLDGSSALAIGYFLRNFLLSASARLQSSVLRKRSPTHFVIPTAAQ
jgi:hypothetical protein